MVTKNKFDTFPVRLTSDHPLAPGLTGVFHLICKQRILVRND